MTKNLLKAWIFPLILWVAILFGIVAVSHRMATELRQEGLKNVLLEIWEGEDAVSR